MICRFEALDVAGAITEPGTSFSAVIPYDAGVVIRRGAVLIETDEGSRYSVEIDRAEVIPDPLGPAVRVTGVLG
jgi:hypothetical protein